MLQTIKNNKNKKVRIIISVIEALLILFALTVKWDALYDTGYNNSLAEFFNRVSAFFSDGNFSDIFVLIGSVFLINKFRNEATNIVVFVFSGVFAFIYLSSYSFMMFSSMLLFNRNGYQFVYSIILWLGVTLTIYYLFVGAKYLLFNVELTEEQDNIKIENFFHRHIFWVSFIVITICWLFWLICIYPGTCSPDAVYQLSQYFTGYLFKWNKLNPPLSTFIMGFMVNAGKIIFKSANIGFFMYLLLQTVVGAAVFAFGVLTLKKEFRIKDSWLMVIVLFFAVVPFWGVYAAFFEKSLIYTEVITFLNLLVFPVVKNREISNKRMVVLCIVCTIAALLRHNGIYAILPLLIALVFYLKSADRRRMIVTILVFLVIFQGANNYVYPALGMQGGSAGEALSLPFQQTAKYLKYYSDEVTGEEKEAIDAVLEYDVIGNVYNYNISNPVKETYKGDDSKLGTYLKVWFKMFFKHPGIYFSAFMDSSYGYIAPVSQSIEVTTDYDYEASGLQKYGLTQQAHKTGVELTNSIRTLNLKMPILRYLCMPGLYTWLLVLVIIGLLCKKKYSMILLCIPAAVNILVCLASPLSSSMRYAQPTVAVAPFLFVMVMYYIKKED